MHEGQQRWALTASKVPARSSILFLEGDRRGSNPRPSEPQFALLYLDEPSRTTQSAYIRRFSANLRYFTVRQIPSSVAPITVKMTVSNCVVSLRREKSGRRAD